MVTIGSVSIVADNLLFSDYSIKFLFYVVFQALAVYFNLYFLMPRLLEKGKYVQYIFLLLVTIIVVAVCIATGYYVSSWLSGKTLLELYQVESRNYFFYFFPDKHTSFYSSKHDAGYECEADQELDTSQAKRTVVGKRKSRDRIEIS